MTALASKVLIELREHGLLLKQDKVLPNVVTLLTGESLTGSWWSHPCGREIFATLSQLAEHPDVLIVKLLRKKDTLVHRALWPSFLTLIRAHESVLSRPLSGPARALLRRVQTASEPVAGSGTALKELTQRVLVYAREVHTCAGRHEMRVQAWSSWQRRMAVRPLDSDEDARRTLERACERIGAPLKDLPWNASRHTPP